MSSLFMWRNICFEKKFTNCPSTPVGGGGLRGAGWLREAAIAWSVLLCCSTLALVCLFILLLFSMPLPLIRLSMCCCCWYTLTLCYALPQYTFDPNSCLISVALKKIYPSLIDSASITTVDLLHSRELAWASLQQMQWPMSLPAYVCSEFWLYTSYDWQVFHSMRHKIVGNMYYIKK